MSEAQNILICESNAALGGMIAAGVSKAGFECTVVEDGREAWDKLQAGGFDAVITEFDLKNDVGTEICRGVRQTKSLQSLPLFVTLAPGSADPAALEAELNPEGLLTKPISVKGLVASLKEKLSGA